MAQDVSELSDQKCLDCGIAQVHFISIPNCIYICENCANYHRNYSRHISIIKPINQELSEFQKRLLKHGGNKNFGKLLQQYEIDLNTPIYQKYQTYAVQCYREYLKVRACGGRLQFDWPSKDQGQNLIGGYNFPPGTYQHFVQNAKGAYSAVTNSGNSVINRIQKKVSNISAFHAVDRKAESFGKKINNGAHMLVRKITSIFQRSNRF